jgi:monofunctional glycosyltransferase
MPFEPQNILVREHSDLLETHAAWRGKGLSGVGFLAARCAAALGAGFLLLNAAVVLFTLWAGLLYSIINPPVTSLMLDRKIEYHFTIQPVRYLSISQIPKSVQYMFIKLEDSTFYENPGIDVASIAHAWSVDRRLGDWALGGSTIGQQLVRSLFLTTNKTISRKYLEAVMALTLNAVMSKQRQLELYLNYIEWGRGVFGIQAAAYASYHRPLSQLSTDEIIRLAAIITSPIRYNVDTLFHNRGMTERYYELWSLQ